jgi:hypothetical protein
MPLLCVLAALSGTPTDGPAGAPKPAAPHVIDVAGPPAGASPLDEPLRLVAEARRAYAAVRDYRCTLIKKERMDGQPFEDNVMTLSVRAEPFSVDLQWLKPDDLVGQEACYVAGRNGGQMRAKSSGFLGAIGFISLDPNDAQAKATSRHAITEAGIGNLIERIAADWEQERRLGLTKVRLAEYDYNHRRCTRVELTRPSDAEGRVACGRTLVYFDHETHLPVRIECYDWPRRAGDSGELLEVYSYAHLKLNVGLGDEVFNH